MNKPKTRTEKELFNFAFDTYLSLDTWGLDEEGVTRWEVFEQIDFGLDPFDIEGVNVAEAYDMFPAEFFSDNIEGMVYRLKNLNCLKTRREEEIEENYTV